MSENPFSEGAAVWPSEDRVPAPKYMKYIMATMRFDIPGIDQVPGCSDKAVSVRYLRDGEDPNESPFTAKWHRARFLSEFHELIGKTLRGRLAGVQDVRGELLLVVDSLERILASDSLKPAKRAVVNRLEGMVREIAGEPSRSAGWMPP